MYHQQINLWHNFFQKMKKEKSDFLQDQEGHTGGWWWDICFAMNFLCSQSKSFPATSIFYFGIEIGSVIPKEKSRKDKLHKGINFIFQKGI